MKLIICGSNSVSKQLAAHRQLESGGHIAFSTFDNIEDKEQELEAFVNMLIKGQYDGIFLLPDWRECKASNHLLAIACTFNKIVMPANGTIIPKQIIFQTYHTEAYAV